MKNNKVLRHWRLLLAAVVVVLGGVCMWNSHLFSTKPFVSTYPFDGPSGVFRGESGKTYVVDTARKDILILNGDMEYIRTIQGGKTDGSSFYYATAVTDGPDGIYVADALYSGKGTIIEAERILRFEPDGSGGEVLYEIDYPVEDAAPRQYGHIKSLELEGDQLLFTVAEARQTSQRRGVTEEDQQLSVYSYSLTTGQTTKEVYDFAGSFAAHAALDPQTGRPVIIAGDTSIQTVDEGGNSQVLATTNEFPYQVTVSSDGTVWYSELNSGALMRLGDQGEMEVVTADVYAYYVSSQGDTICVSDGAGIAIYENDEIQYMTSVPIGNAGLRTLMWCLLALAVVSLLILAVSGGKVVVRSWLAYPFFRKIAVVILAAIVASSVVAWYMLSTTFREEEALTLAQQEAIAAEIVAHTDLELVERIEDSTHYKSEAFNNLKAQLDAVINAGYDRGEYFYYLTYVTDKEMIYGLMDYEDTVRTWMAYDVYGAEGYTDVFETGEPLLVEGEVSTWGAWTLLLVPVFDEEGNVAAVQEVGFNFDNQRIAQQQTIVETVLTILFGAIVLVMLIIEGIYFMEHRKNRREIMGRIDAVYDQTDIMPLRTLVFLAFTVDCMQDAFISILATKLYEPVFGIPQSVGAALPISGQVLMAAVFAVVGGFLASRFGPKKVICLGFLIEAGGFLICGLTLNYFGILAGKLLVGAGVGMVTVGVNTVAASSTDSSKSVVTFAGITAGTLVGVSAGSGLGSTILSMGSYRMVFFTGVGILAVGFLLALSSRAGLTTQVIPETHQEESAPAQEVSSIGMGRFLFGKGGTIPFLALILMPFMTAIYFREYFFPIYAAENGITETTIGQIYVLLGLMIIYAGPALIQYLEENLGPVRSVVLSSGIVALGSLSYALIPNLAGAFLGILLVSLAVSCGYTAQSSYYSSMEAVSRFGEGRSMGIYSLFDNGGQTLGPIIYGSAMLLGYQTGMLAVGVALGLLTAVFAGIKRKDFKTPIGSSEAQEVMPC